MFKVGDIVKVVNGRRGDRYRVIAVNSVFPNNELVLRNVNQSDSNMNFTSYGDGHLELDEIYLRRKKLDNIIDRLDSLYLMNHAKEVAEANKHMKWLFSIEERKRKIKKICSKLVT